MADFTQTPGKLDITATHGDDFEFFLDFDIPLSGYTFSSSIVKISTNALVPLTVTAIDLAEGKIKISLSKATLATISNAVHHWYLDWNTGSQERRILAGTFEIVDYPDE